MFAGSVKRPSNSRKISGGTDSSARKTLRVSKIPQPTRRCSLRKDSLERTPSIDALNVPVSSNPKRTRYCNATPLRTPNRTIYNNSVSLTCEKKKEAQNQVAKINEYLHIIEPILGKEFFTRGGLKYMSTKQFITIIKHFVKAIAGNRLSIGTNYVDDIAKFLAQIKYPYPVNKSWLKTPTAPHSFNNVVTLIGWLFTFIPNENNAISFEDGIVPGEELLDKDFTGKFLQRAEEGFILWNNTKEDELETIKQGLVDEIICKMTGIQGVLGVEDEIININKAINELVQNKVEIIGEEEFSKLDNDIKCSKLKVSNLERDYKQNLEQLTQLHSTFNNKKLLVHETEARLTTIKNEINKQEISKKRRDDLISQLSFLRQSLETKKKFICELQDMDAINQVHLSRLIKQEVETISKFNKYLCHVLKSEIFLDRNQQDQLEFQLDRIVPLLGTEKRMNRENYAKYTDKINDFSRQLKVATHKHDTILQIELTNLTQNCNKLQKKIEEIDKKLVSCEGLAYQQIESLSSKFKEFWELNNQTKNEITSKHKELKTLKTRNENVLNRIVSKGKDVLTEKELKARKIAEVIDRLKKKVDIALNLDYN